MSCLITTRDEINPCSDKKGSSITKREALAGAKRGRNYHNGSSNGVSDYDDDVCVLNYGRKGNKIGWRRNT